MKNTMIPRKTTICKLADGHQVRIIDMNAVTEKVRVKSLRTGLPFSVQRCFLFDL
jgi:hypothetical protein